MNRYVIGIDTGGTFTDGVLLHYRSREVVSTAKTLTTRGDLKQCVVNVLNQLEIAEEYDIKLVGISSTLATNSIAEGKASRVGLLLIGYDKDLIESYGLKDKFATSNIAYFSGGHNAQGIEKAPVDEEGLKEWIKENYKDVDAIAISSYFSPLNPEHEKKAYEIISNVSDLPIVMGHQLSSQIDSVRRAATASINASLVAVMHDFIEAVRYSLKDRSINAPLMIVRGDGTLMPYTEAVQKPVETVLSGPAASAIGGRFLSEKGRSLVIDVGSTTTDMALVQNSRVVVSDEGAQVGNTSTAVKAAKIRTISIGCDSKITVDNYNDIHIGPEKVTPLCQLAGRFDSVKKELNTLKDKTEYVSSKDLEYWLLYRPIEQKVYDNLNATQKYVVDLIQSEPKSLSEIISEANVYHAAHLNLDFLMKQGYIEVAFVTPSDLLHTEEKMELWDVEAAKSALRYISRIAGIKRSEFYELAMEKIVSSLVEAVFIYLACQDTKTRMPDKIDGVWGKWLMKEAVGGKNDFMTIHLDSRVPIIGTGAPAEIFLKEAVKYLNAHFILPRHHEVANAVGAVSGSVMETREAMVFIQSSGDTYDYIVKNNGTLNHFDEYEEACDYAEDSVRSLAKEAASEAGASDPYVELQVVTEGSLQRFIARAVGNPRLSETAKSN